MSEVEAALELSALDPDTPLPSRLQGALRRSALAGALTGLEWGGPVTVDAADIRSIVPASALEAGSFSHADFIH